MVLPSYAGVTGWSALRWLGGYWFSGEDADGARLPVQLLVRGRRIRPQEGIAVCQELATNAGWQVVDGVQLTSVESATAFEMRYAADARAAGVIFEMAAYNDLISRDELAAYMVHLQSMTGVPQVREIAPHLDENAWSPQEVRLRQVAELDGGFERLLTNRPIFDRFGNHLGTPDLLDEEAGLVFEYNGEDHNQPAQRKRDAERLARFGRAGLGCVVVVAGEGSNRDRLVAKLQDARAGASFEAASRRAWTTKLPAWWVPTFTVDQRRELREEERQRWLRLRNVA